MNNQHPHEAFLTYPGMANVVIAMAEEMAFDPDTMDMYPENLSRATFRTLNRLPPTASEEVYENDCRHALKLARPFAAQIIGIRSLDEYER